MITLSFYIKSYHTNEINHDEFYVAKQFDKSTTFSEILEEMYNKYSYINNGFCNYSIIAVNYLFWGSFFSNNIVANIPYSLLDYESYNIDQLDIQFNISKKEIPLILNPNGIGKAVGNSEGVSFFFHTNEKDLHHTPHIHCKYSGTETRIDIQNIKVLDKPFKSSKMKLALNIIRNNQQSLINYWNHSVINGESMKFHLEI